MSITIENAEAEQLVAELSTRVSKQPDELVLDLLRRERARLDERFAEAREAARKLQTAWAALPVVDPRPLDQIVEFDENGLPV
jgi:hypothetical protein